MMHRRLLVLALLAPLACNDRKATADGAEPKPSTAPAEKAAPTPEKTAPPAPTVAAPSSDVPTAVANANITMNDATIDGLKMKGISCNAPQANPFTAITKLSPLAKQKAALDACVDKPAEVALHFAVKDKKASDVRVAGAPTAAAAACIAKAVEGAAWNDSLTCVVKTSLPSSAK